MKNWKFYIELCHEMMVSCLNPSSQCCSICFDAKHIDLTMLFPYS